MASSPFIKGTLEQEQARAQALGDLAHTETAEKARDARQKGSRRPLRNMGVLGASKARGMAIRKEEGEFARAHAMQ